MSYGSPCPYLPFFVYSEIRNNDVARKLRHLCSPLHPTLKHLHWIVNSGQQSATRALRRRLRQPVQHCYYNKSRVNSPFMSKLIKFSIKLPHSDGFRVEHVGLNRLIHSSTNWELAFQGCHCCSQHFITLQVCESAYKQIPKLELAIFVAACSFVICFVY